MFLSKIFKFILILSVIGSVYLFGVISLKFSIFPFSYNLTGLVSWTSEQIFGKEINSYEKNKINSSYNESYTSLLFDFDVTWFSIDFKDSYGAIVPLSKAKVILVSQVGEIFEIDIKTGALAKLKIPKILINEDDFKKTIDIMNKIKFINSYSFIFSARPGTPSANLKKISGLFDKSITPPGIKVLAF